MTALFDESGIGDHGITVRSLTPHSKWSLHSEYQNNLFMPSLSQGGQTGRREDRGGGPRLDRGGRPQRRGPRARSNYDERYVIPPAHAEQAHGLEESATECSLDHEGWPGMSGPFGESSRPVSPIAVENFHMLRGRQTTDTIAAPVDKGSRVNRLAGAPTPSSLVMRCQFPLPGMKIPLRLGAFRSVRR